MGFFNFSKQDQPQKAEEQPIQPAQKEWEGREDGGNEELFSVPVKAGKRIYYFDVKSTRGEDYFVTITESRKKQLRDGSFVIDKHKIHLYKEDFAKFADGFQQVLDYVRKHKPDSFESAPVTDDQPEQQ